MGARVSLLEKRVTMTYQAENYNQPFYKICCFSPLKNRDDHRTQLPDGCVHPHTHTHINISAIYLYHCIVITIHTQVCENTLNSRAKRPTSDLDLPLIPLNFSDFTSHH